MLSCSDSPDLEVNTPPEAAFVYGPDNIDTTTLVYFNASGSTDDQDSQLVLRFSWDFEGNQNWTTPTTSYETTYKYGKPGVYNAGLKVIDTHGWSGETSKTIIVQDTVIIE